MKIVNINVGDLKKSGDAFLKWLYASGADVVCLQDTITQSSELSEELQYPQGYEAYFFDSSKAGTGGVAIYTRELPKAIIMGLGFETADLEGRYIQADFDQVSVASFSFPDEINPSLRKGFRDNFFDFVKKVARKRREYILTGSLKLAHSNLDVAKWQTSYSSLGFTQEERLYCDAILRLDFVDVYRYMNRNGADYTFFPEKDRDKPNANGWRIDYQFASHNMAKNILRSWVDSSTSEFSLHNALWAEYNLN